MPVLDPEVFPDPLLDCVCVVFLPPALDVFSSDFDVAAFPVVLDVVFVVVLDEPLLVLSVAAEVVVVFAFEVFAVVVSFEDVEASVVSVVALTEVVPVSLSITLTSEECRSHLRALRISSFFQIPTPTRRTAAIPEATRLLRQIIAARRFFSFIRSSALRKTLSDTCL